MYIRGIGIFHPVLSTAGLLSHRPAATAPLRKVIAAAMVFIFPFQRIRPTPRAAMIIFMITRESFLLLFLNILLCAREQSRGAQCSSSNNKSAHQHHGERPWRK